ncbi:hypothetical protein D3C78_1258260 [compost metagenome]
MIHGKPQGMHRIHCLQDHGCLEDAVSPQPGQADKPQNGDGAEKTPHAARAFHLYGKQAHQNADGDGHNIVLEMRSGDADALHRRKH